MRLAGIFLMRVRVSKKIGIFGGTFSPFHMGHLNSVLTVAGELKLDQVRVIPANQSPNRPQLQGPTPEERLDLVRLGISSYDPLLVVDNREIVRGGVSYTQDTIQDLRNEFPKDHLYLIVGADQFEHFDHWKFFARILDEVDLVVTSRPGSAWPDNLENFPPGVRSLITHMKGTKAELYSGRWIHFVPLKDIDVSGSELRRRLGADETLEGLVPAGVEEMIRKKGWFENLKRTIENYQDFCQDVGRLLNEKKAINVVGFDLGDNHFPARYTLVASGSNTRQTNAIAEFLMRSVREVYGFWPQSIEGQLEGRWVVLDYGALIVHIFYDYVRQEYKLEDLWATATKLQIEDSHASFRKKPEGRLST